VGESFPLPQFIHPSIFIAMRGCASGWQAQAVKVEDFRQLTVGSGWTRGRQGSGLEQQRLGLGALG
jgi:hypothetical protein